MAGGEDHKEQVAAGGDTTPYTPECGGEEGLPGQLRELNERLLLAGLAAQDQAEREEAMRREVERLNTDLLAANERLRVEDRLKDEFLAMLAHELRNPLAAILGAAQVLDQEQLDPHRQARARSIVDRQAWHMARLLDDLLDVSRITRGKIELVKQQVEIAAVVEQAVQGCQPPIAERGHALYVSVPPEPVWVQADPDRLQQIVANLLSNAARYTDPGGHIWLTVTREGADAVVRVRDTGAGIAPELLPRIFDLFVQAERTPGRKQGGLGLGLTLVRRLVETHGGSVTADSAGPGRGSEFAVRLPALPAPARPRPEPEAETPVTPRRILLVDDNADMAEMLSELLEMDGHQVVVAHSGPAALDAAREFRPEVVLLDIGLPGMDGYEVACRLRQQDGPPGARLVAVTGYGQEQDRQRSCQAGFDDHLTKPVDLDDLRRALRAFESPCR